MINEHETNDDYQECVCNRCGSPDCDGLKNCEVCGEDTYCDRELCHHCEEQDRIEEVTSNPNFDPAYYR